MPDVENLEANVVLALNALRNIATRLSRNRKGLNSQEVDDLARDLSYHLAQLGWDTNPPWDTTRLPTGDR